MIERQQTVLSQFDQSDDINKVLNVEGTRARLRTLERVAISSAEEDDDADKLVVLVHEWHELADERLRKSALVARSQIGKR